jgi:hydrogenase nickel incorporation protein HypA/HybF
LEAEFPERFASIQTIYLTVGELSNVQPILMQNAFNAVLEDEPRYRNKHLEVQVLPIKIFCGDCNLETIVKQYKFICSKCGKASKNIIQGDELLISKVEFELIKQNN